MPVATRHIRSTDSVALLRNPLTYRNHTTSVQVLETHISWVFLADTVVYKLKKPVHFEFLDFSTPERRRHACLEEVRLNRRLAPAVYLGVLPITLSDLGQLELGGDGEPQDWVVEMRRLPAEAALDRRLAVGHVSRVDEQALISLLSAFYRSAAAAMSSGDEFRTELERNIRANAAECMTLLADHDRLRVRRILGRQLLFLRTATTAFDERVAAGRVVEGHGDLRPEHIFLESPPVIIDCIEFSPQLRRVDVLDDLAFLELELERLGHRDLGLRIVDACQTVLHDHANSCLVDFYKSHHALVRAKVSMLQAVQLPLSDRQSRWRLSHQYVDWAEHDAHPLGRPVLIVVGGIMGTGKSTLAAQLAEAIEADLLSTDRVRHTLYGASENDAAYGEGHYTPDSRARIYEQLFVQAAHALDRDFSVVLDGTFLKRDLREHAAVLARQHGAIPLYVHCHCPRRAALARLALRAASGASDSEGRPELFDQQAAEQEAPGGDPPAMGVDTTLATEEQLPQVFRKIARLDSLRRPGA